jgi:methyl-accepting chemotaxis protein
MSVFKKLSLKLKILAMVVPLGFWLSVVSVYMLNDFHKQRTQLEGLAQVTDAYDDNGELIDALQIERAKSAQYLSKSNMSFSELENHYKEKTDPRITEVKRMINVELPFPKDEAEQVITILETVFSIRKEVQARAFSIEEMNSAYNIIIQELMVNEGVMAKFYAAKGIEMHLVNITIVEALKDNISRSQPAFTAAFTKNAALTAAESGSLESIRSSITTTIESPGLQLIPAMHAKINAVLDSPEWQELQNNMDTIKTKANSGSFGVDAQVFYNKMGQINDKIKVAISSERRALVIFAIDEASKANKIFYAVLIFVIMTIVGISIFCWFTIRDLIMKESAEIISNMAAVRSASMVDNSPVPTMMCDPQGKLIYFNDASIQNLNKLQTYLPDKVANLMGQTFDIFHKNPELQRKIISDPRNLPHKAIISLGPEKLDLLVTASVDSSGKYLGAGVAWNIVTKKVELIRDLTKSSDDLASAASNVLSISSNLSAAAEETSAQANTASVASEEVNSGVQTVAGNMEQMVSAIKEITKTTNEAASMTNEAMRLAQNTNKIINQLSESSMDIGNVIKVISSIAQQTNLLALNATIEAARAGEAGKGFAVVANEVKELAKQTAVATNEITKKIENIQHDSQNAVDAIAEIGKAIEKVNGYTGNIAASVEEQAATTNEVTRIVEEAAVGVKQINENISQVSQAAADTGKDAGNAQVAAKGVEDIAELLKKYVADLKLE